jgi:hypothetical protein
LEEVVFFEPSRRPVLPRRESKVRATIAILRSISRAIASRLVVVVVEVVVVVVVLVLLAFLVDVELTYFFNNASARNFRSRTSLRSRRAEA